jgi:DNA polymerase-3 subunit delta'
VRFSEVQHQEGALSILRRALRSGRMPHAYLFEGPEGVGKELTALALAARLLCEDDTLAPDADACGQCPACRLVATDNHPDLHLIHRGLHKVHPDRTIRQSKGLFLVVDLIRVFVMEPATMKPTQGRRRVFIIRDAERMNEEAQNALLKTLEEPPGTACLILVTSSASRLLPTIRSRCQCVPFRLLPAEFVGRELQARLDLPATDAQALAALCGGRLGVAIRWQWMGLLAALDTVGVALDRMPDGDPEAFAKTLIEIAATLASSARQVSADEDKSESEEEDDAPRSGGRAIPTDELRDALKLVLLLVGAIYRDALVSAAGATALRQVPQQQQRVTALARQAPPARLETSLRAVREAEYMLDRNVAPQLVGERLAVALLGELAVL